MVGDFELVYEKEMNMYRIKRTESEDFSNWLSSEEAEELKQMDEDDFFTEAEKFLSHNE